jgi:hypothetical protein
MHCLLACLLASLLLVEARGQEPPPNERASPRREPIPQAPVVEESSGQESPKSVAKKEGEPVSVGSAPDATPPRLRPRPEDATALLGLFARMPGLEATYTEEKHLALLAAPLQSSGRICFLPPGHLIRQVESPEPTMLRITPNELVVQDRDRKESVDLRRSESLRQFITSLVQVFAGDQKSLQRAFTIVYALDAKSERMWSLELTPKGAQLQRMMQRLALRGEGEAVTSIEVLDPNGDRTTTTILTADVARRFDADEKKRLFGIEPP